METKAPLNRGKQLSEKLWHGLFMGAALFAVVAVVAIIGLIFTRGLRPFLPGNEFGTYNFWQFLTGLYWRPNLNEFGIGFMIGGSVFATIGAIVIGVPIGVLTAVFIAEVAPKPIAKIMQPVIELLAAIPSVIYGVFGFAIIVPMINDISPQPMGNSLLAVILVLSIMVLPSIIAISITSIQAVPKHYKEGSLALGASRGQTIFKVMLPAARSGILTAVVLGVGRAIGETMAVILVAGNTESGFPTSIFDSIRPLTAHIVLEQAYAVQLHEQLLFSTVIVLFFFIMLVNVTLTRIRKKAVDN